MPRRTPEERLQRQLKNAKKKLRRALPADPECKNDERATRAKAAVMAYRQLTNTRRKDAVGDLLCDLKHLCDRDRRFRTFEDSLELAEQRYQKETADWEHRWVPGQARCDHTQVSSFASAVDLQRGFPRRLVDSRRNGKRTILASKCNLLKVVGQSV
jgi:hypothetical protein